MNESSKERKERLSVATANAVELQDLEWILCTCISLYPVKIFSSMTVWKKRETTLSMSHLKSTQINHSH